MASECSPTPMVRASTTGNAAVMNHYRTALSADASALLAAATRFQEDARGADRVALLAASLTDVEEALRALSGSTQSAAHALIPPGSIAESVSHRYARAAAAWPGLGGDGAPPSYERQAQLLTALDDAGVALRESADCCRRARDILVSTLPVQTVVRY